MTTTSRRPAAGEADFRVTDTAGKRHPLTVASAYVHSGEADTPKQVDKYRFLDVIQPVAELSKHSDHALVDGDLNVGHTELDIKNWKGNVKRAGFLPQERAYFDRFFGEEIGWKDVHRAWRVPSTAPTPGGPNVARTSTTTRLAHRYHMANPRRRSCSAVVDRAPSWDTRFSDHAPLVVDYRL